VRLLAPAAVATGLPDLMCTGAQQRLEIHEAVLARMGISSDRASSSGVGSPAPEPEVKLSEQQLVTLVEELRAEVASCKVRGRFCSTSLRRCRSAEAAGNLIGARVTGSVGRIVAHRPRGPRPARSGARALRDPG
jgi:hypothetical protein